MNDIKPPEAGNTSLRFGKAFLRPHAKEPGHYELMRPIVTVRNEGDKTVTEAHGDPLPLAVYRIKGRGDKTPEMRDMVAEGPPPEMRTADPKTGQPLTLTLVWWPGKD